MTEHEHKKEATDWREHDALDSELDAALAKYASIEPRAGLEARVLANLRVERQKASHWGLWRWRSLVLVMVMIVVAWALAWKLGRPRSEKTAQRPPATTLSSQPGPHVVSTGEEKGIHPHRPIVVRKSSVQRAHPPVIVAAQPKLEQFPSPRPLSEQEKMLASYVAKYPEHATLIARARAEGLRRDTAERLETGQGGHEDSQQQVR